MTEGKRGGCLSILIAGGMTTLIGIGVAVVGCIGLCVVMVIAIGAGAEQNQKEALAANGGYGTKENPIPRGLPVIFEDFTMRPVQMVWPATTQILQNSPLNEPPASGTDYVLVYFEMACNRAGSALCEGSDFHVRLVDDTGAEWGEPEFLVIDDSINPKEAVGGSAMTGWQAFEFPQGRRMASIKLWVIGGAELFVRPPQP